MVKQINLRKKRQVAISYKHESNHTKVTRIMQGYLRHFPDAQKLARPNPEKDYVEVNLMANTFEAHGQCLSDQQTPWFWKFVYTIKFLDLEELPEEIRRLPREEVPEKYIQEYELVYYYPIMSCMRMWHVNMLTAIAQQFGEPAHYPITAIVRATPIHFNDFLPIALARNIPYEEFDIVDEAKYNFTFHYFFHPDVEANNDIFFHFESKKGA